MKLKNSGKFVPALILSYEQEGIHPMLLSEKTQADLGMVKDMREDKVFLRDHCDFIDVDRDSRTGIRV
eukprot:11630705-Karenia_brevis.AAC.1